MKKYLISLIVIVGILLAGFQIADANPSYQIPVAPTATATSSVRYLTGNTASTTYTYDSYGSGITNLTDYTALLIQASASTTGSILGWRYEYADNTPGQDCTLSTANCDWYGDSLAYATTTLSIGAQDTRNVAPYSDNIWPIATTTASGFIGSNKVGTLNKIVLAYTPTRYIRVVFYATGGSNPVSVWAKWIPRREQK